MTTGSYVAVILAILLPAVLYFYLAVKANRSMRDFATFFPLSKFVGGDEFGRSTAAAGVSLATVLLALVNLAPFIGIGLFVTISSYVASFVLLYWCAPRILAANPDNDTIQAYLGKAYDSRLLERVSVLFSFIGIVSIFAMELLVGVTVLEPFMGERVYIFSALYLVFIVGYSIIGGFRAVVAAEQYQIIFIIAGVLALLSVIPLVYSGNEARVALDAINSKVLSSWNATWGFALGIIALNLPAALSDSGTWQRLCATKSVGEAKRGIARAIPMFIFIWGAMILGACYLAQIAQSVGSFDPGKGSLMTYVVTVLGGGTGIEVVLLFTLMLGLFAAMITTADSLLLVAAQIFVIDVLDLRRANIDESSKVHKSRVVLAAIALAAFSLFALFKWIKFDVVQLVFSIYGANLALFPSVALALFASSKLKLSTVRRAAALSILVGFLAAWSSAIFGKWGGDPNYLYNAPVVALFASGIVLAVGLLIRQRA